MTRLLIKNARMVNEGEIRETDLLVEADRIARIDASIAAKGVDDIIDAGGRYLIPGMIDDQVHFREPGLTHKGDIATESAAAAAGGITSFMEMPNVDPQTTTREALAAKYERARGRAVGNYGFYLGATNDNLGEIRRLEPGEACGIKVFMGASTGAMLVDDADALDAIFRDAPLVIATHCEHTPTILENEAHARQTFGDDVPMAEHPRIRSANACLTSSSFAVELATRHDALLHVLHLTTAIEMELFNAVPLQDKRITGEVCVHHLWFDDSDYEACGTRIKCNPAIKTRQDRDALRKAVREGRIDVIATDHAPHTAKEKAGSYFEAPAGLPLVQHALPLLFDLARAGELDVGLIVEKTSHAPAEIFGVAGRGYLREGYFADLVIVDPRRPWRVTGENVLYKCGWSPFEGHEFSAAIDTTVINGSVVFRDGQLTGVVPGRRLEFTRIR